MSFDIFVGCFRQGKPAPLPEGLVDTAFRDLVESEEDDCWVLAGGGELFADPEDGDADFMVASPPDDDAFWEGVLLILRQTPSVLYWLEGGAIVGSEATIGEMPADMIETLGTPLVARSAQDIVDRIAAS
jgi:hypothetical protein